MTPTESTPNDSFTVPTPAQVARRIPEGLAFTVRASPWRVAVASLMMGLVWATILMGASFPLLLGGTDSAATAGLVVVSAGVVGAVLFGSLMGLVMASGGPLAACDDNGLWLRARQWPARAVFLPWHAVRTVYSRRWGVQKVVCVQAHDPSVGTGLGVLADLERIQSNLFTGAGMIIPTLQADKRSVDILRSFAHHSRGRCEVRQS